MVDMQPMETAPKDRGILLRMANEVGLDAAYYSFAVAKYAQWDGGTGRYGEVWETGPGECTLFNDANLMGWYELPTVGD